MSGAEGSADLATRLRALADEMIDPLICRTPAYGAPGHAHCAACCYGTGLVIQDEDDQLIADAVYAMNRAAPLLEAVAAFARGESPHLSGETE